MSTTAQVRLWGRAIGAVSVPGPGQVATFEYESKFQRSGLEVAPLMMPLKGGPYSFPALSRASFHGLPGMLADALPDKFGNAVIGAWLASQGRSAEDLDAVERLCYTGTRGMGALEFKPAQGPGAGKSETLKVDALVALASDVLRRREKLLESVGGADTEKALLQILRVGASAGGARAKALIAWNPDTNEVRSGQVKAPPGFEYWLMKFDGVSDNTDRDLADPKGFGAIEYAYSLMARAAGIRMSECRLFEENGRRHFMTRRFDRLSDGKKLHMQSLAAMAHLDFNDSLSHSYEQAFDVMKSLKLPKDEVEEQFRRMVFNVVARNQDDHVKNIAYLMDQSGRWSLAPAFDVMYSYNPSGQWTRQHQMSLAGKRDGFTLDDLRTAAKTASLKGGRAEEITRQVTLAVRRWREFADEAKVPHGEADKIARVHRTDLIS